MKHFILTLSILTAAQAVPAQEFRLAVISASDLSALQSPAAEPVQAVAELSGMDPAEAAAYLADSEMPEEDGPRGSEEPQAGLGGDGALSLYHQWHHETLEIRYRDGNGRYIPEALARIRRFMRCRLTGREAEVPPRLLEIIDAIQDRHQGRRVTVICGYRSSELNRALAANSGAVAKRSLHLRGWAADIKIEGVRTSALRDTARSLRAGGVGYYPSDGFVHVDTGRVRNW